MNLPPFSSQEVRSVTERNRRQVVAELRQQLARGELASTEFDEKASWVSSGCQALDALLSGQGFRRGTISEWFVEESDSGGGGGGAGAGEKRAGEKRAGESGGGAGTVALLLARQACVEGGVMVIVDGEGWFYPPAAAAWGIDLQRLVIIRPLRTAEMMWALEQALRSPAVKAVWSWLGEVNDRWFRRFQLAAESSGCLGFFLRSRQFRGRPSWSDSQWLVTASPQGTATSSGDGHRAFPGKLGRSTCRDEAWRWS